MRILRSLFVFAICLALAACQTSKSAASEVETASVGAAEPSAPPAEHMCGGNCCGGMAEASASVPVEAPADALWTEMKVSGMHCGMCARKIESAVAVVEGVVAVTADPTTGLVRIATARGARDIRAEVTPRIDALGYRVTP
jgi:copper chaperone CopZ